MSSKDYGLHSKHYAVAGAAGGVFTRFICQPFDVVKIRFQVQTSPISARSANSQYTSMLQAVIKIHRDEGIKALWKGHIPAQWLSAVFGAVQFATYEYTVRPWRKNSLAHFGGGAVGGVTAVLASFPFDVVRTRLVAQGEPKTYQGMVDCGMQVVSVSGWRGLFRGLIPACVQTAPLTGLIFGFNHILLSALKKLTSRKDVSTIETLCCGSVAGFAGKTIVYPLDLVKKRLQMQGMPQGSSASGPIMQTSGLLHCIKKVYKTEGWKGYYKGLTPSVVKSAFSNAIYMTSYDKACRLISYMKSKQK